MIQAPYSSTTVVHESSVSPLRGIRFFWVLFTVNLLMFGALFVALVILTGTPYSSLSSLEMETIRAAVHYRPDGALDDPHPHFFAADTGAVEVHKNGFDWRLKADLFERINGGIAKGGAHVNEGFVRHDNKFRLFVAGDENRFDAVASQAEAAVAPHLKGLEIIPTLGTNAT